MSDTIDVYLAQLRQTLEVSRRARRRILWEVADHLREAAAREERRGLSPEAAQRAAIARFGSPQLVAHSFEAEAIEQRKRRASQTFFLALAEFAVLCILLALLTLYLDTQAQLASGPSGVVVSPTVLAICQYVAILCAILLFLEAVSLFLFSFARAEGVRWHLLSLLPLGLGIWFLLLAERLQAAYQELPFVPSIHAAYAPYLAANPQQTAVQAMYELHLLGAIAAGFTLLLLFLAWLELRLRPYGKRTALPFTEADLLNLAR
jgi:hypothetical protein